MEQALSEDSYIFSIILLTKRRTEIKLHVSSYFDLEGDFLDAWLSL